MFAVGYDPSMPADILFTTPRLAVRMMRDADAPVVAAYRDDPAVNVYQDWDLPYTLEIARDRLAK